MYLFLLAVILVDCGKKAPPLPPLVIYPALVRDLVVRQEGTKFVLYFSAPTANNDGTPLTDLEHIDIYRLTEDQPPPVPQSQPAAQSQPGQTQPAAPPPAPAPVIAPTIEVTVQDFSSRAGSIYSITAEKLAESTQGNYVVFVDDLANFQPPRGLTKRFTYAVQPFGKKERGPGFSNRVTLDMIRLADPPKDLKSVVQETGVVIAWTAPATNIDGTTPPAIVGYNIYRRLAEEKYYPADPINSSPYPTSPYVDAGASYDSKYAYMVKGVNSANRPYQETARSNEITVEPKDEFAPKPPQNVVAVASKSGINLLWSASQEKDLGGYRVYRRTGSNDKFELISPEGLVKNTFLDTTVQPKKTYYYVVTAIDKTTPPNESTHSNEAKEYMP